MIHDMTVAKVPIKIALLGLGIMGLGMARQLLLHGFPLTVFNRNTQKARPLEADGASVAASPCEAAAQADVIISMVSDDQASRTLWLGSRGALAAARPGTACIECSTLSVGWVCELAAAAKSRNCDFLDAPVTGSKTHAASGELNFLIGGMAATIERVRPIFAAMGKSIIPLGPTGSGALIKLINNFVCGVQVASLAEAITMIERGGLDRAKALDVLLNGAPGSPIVKTVAARMTSEDYAPHFPLRLMAKDLGYALQEAGKMSLELLTAASALERFNQCIAASHGDKDMAAVVEPLRKKQS